MSSARIWVLACLLPGGLLASSGTWAGRGFDRVEPMVDLECEQADSMSVRHYWREARRMLLQVPDTTSIASFQTIAVSPSGRLLLVDMADYNVKVFKPDGRFLSILGRRGREVGMLLHPAAATFLNDSTVAVADDDRLKLLLFDFRGGFLREFDLPYRPIGGLDSVAGDLLVAGLGPLGGDGKLIYSVHRVALDGSTVHSDQPIPERFSRKPALRRNRLPFLAVARRPVPPKVASARFFMTWRLGNTVVEIDEDGRTVGKKNLPITDHFIDPRPVIDSLRDDQLRNVLDSTSPIVRILAAGDFLIIGYFAAFQGDQTLRFQLLSVRDKLRLVASDLTGGALYTGYADTIVSLAHHSGSAPGQTKDLDIVLLVPCAAGARK